MRATATEPRTLVERFYCRPGPGVPSEKQLSYVLRLAGERLVDSLGTTPDERVENLSGWLAADRPGGSEVSTWISFLLAQPAGAGSLTRGGARTGAPSATRTRRIVMPNNEQTFAIGDPAMRPNPMDPVNGPGWNIDVYEDGKVVATYQLWAPRTAQDARKQGTTAYGVPAHARTRACWAACWTMNLGLDGNVVTADSPSVALTAFHTCPRREEALNAAMALLTAAHEHIAATQAAQPDHIAREV